MEFPENLHYSIFLQTIGERAKVKENKNFYKTALSLSHADVIYLIDVLKYVQQ